MKNYIENIQNIFYGTFLLYMFFFFVKLYVCCARRYLRMLDSKLSSQGKGAHSGC